MIFLFKFLDPSLQLLDLLICVLLGIEAAIVVGISGTLRSMATMFVIDVSIDVLCIDGCVCYGIFGDQIGAGGSHGLIAYFFMVLKAHMF